METTRPGSWLGHIRVLQADEHMSTSYAGYLLRRLGAEVILGQKSREAFEGDEGFYELLNGGVRPAEAGELVDLVIAGPVASPGAEGIPGVPLVRVDFDPGAWGTAEPIELLAEASSGWMMVSGDLGRDRAPIRAAGHQILLQAGAVAALLGLAAYRDHQRTGRVRQFSLGIRELGVTLHNCLAKAAYAGEDAVFNRGVTESQPTFVSMCADGPIFVVAVEEVQWTGLCEAIGAPELATVPEFSTRLGRYLNFEALKAIIDDRLAPQLREEVAARCAALAVPTTPVYGAADLLELPQLAARSAWNAARVGGHELRLPATPWTVAPGALQAGEPPRTRPGWSIGGPLEDIFVTETSWVWAAPYCSELLAWLGASVVKVESDRHIDLFRRSIAAPGQEPSLDNSPAFNQLNLGKGSTVLDLTNAEDLETFWRLVECSDVFLSNFRPGVLERRGVTSERLAEVPGLIAARISGYGDAGPWAERVLYGAVAVMLGGIGAYTGYPETLPATIGFAFGDPCSGHYTALAIVAALCHRDREGSGRIIETSILETIVNQAADLLLEQQIDGAVPRLGNGHARFAPHGVYACGDESWLALAVLNDAHWKALAGGVGCPPDLAALDAAARLRSREALDAVLTRWASEQPGAADAQRKLQDLGVPSCVLASPGRLTVDPALLANEYAAPIDHPVAGTRVIGGAPWRMDGGRPRLRRAPLLGEDTAAIAAEAAGARNG